ncbi:uncharacterized protein LOC110374828 [Helicoverpa armigera]|uniref:uncharacterized protein LOC110374828 n=1 Tax=Helicoverpa armigera TaxID=29058 RepID=UPI003083372F
MLKKVHISNSSDTLSAEKKLIQCSVCCKTVAKSVLYVCNSGHVICKSCQRCDAKMEDRNECGDFNPEEDFNTDNDMKQVKSCDGKADLASGDHDEALISQGLDNEMKDFCKDEDGCKENSSKHTIETTIEYKNPYYQESKSSGTPNHDSIKTSETIQEETQNCNSVQRPVLCPVSNCSKMVTIDSIMLHFHFDHSKVPRTTIDDITPQEVSLKCSNFSTDVQCVATFIIETQRQNQTNKKRTESVQTGRSSIKDSKLLLLMAVRMPTNYIKLPNVKCDASRIFTRTIHTQTEKIYESDLETNTDSFSKDSSDYKSCINKYIHDDDEVILLWLCKLDDAEKVFSVTLLGEDKRRGYCYIGDAVHVRDKQDPSLLYDRSECLIVKSSAVSDLYDERGRITAIVSMIG